MKVCLREELLIYYEEFHGRIIPYSDYLSFLFDLQVSLLPHSLLLIRKKL